jgi:hypothetical protein
MLGTFCPCHKIPAKINFKVSEILALDHLTLLFLSHGEQNIMVGSMW